MIVYDPLWRTMKDKKISTYALRQKYSISGETIQRLKTNKPVSTTTLNDLCGILDCRIEQVLTYKKDEI